MILEDDEFVVNKKTSTPVWSQALSKDASAKTLVRDSSNPYLEVVRWEVRWKLYDDTEDWEIKTPSWVEPLIEYYMKSIANGHR